MGSSTGREVLGDADEAVRCVRVADLPRHDRRNLARCIERFPSLTYTRDGVVLPRHIRRAGFALSFVHPPLLAMFDGFDYECNASDAGVDMWYSIGLGNAGDETPAAA
ncbi:hypothetical protein [Yinghuangia aomiensis]